MLALQNVTFQRVHKKSADTTYSRTPVISHNYMYCTLLNSTL